MSCSNTYGFLIHSFFFFSVFSVEPSHFCPVCKAEMVHIDRHLITVHRTVPLSEEQAILCKLGKDRIPLVGGPFRCPLFREVGCPAYVEHPKHHLKNSKIHPGLGVAAVTLALRPLRYKLAMQQLRELRTAKASLVTDLDEVYFGKQDEGAAGPSAPSNRPCINKNCKQQRRQIAVLKKIIGSLRSQLSLAQKVSRDFWYN